MQPQRKPSPHVHAHVEETIIPLRVLQGHAGSCQLEDDGGTSHPVAVTGQLCLHHSGQ